MMILLFPGNNMPTKRYNNFAYHLNKRYPHSQITIITDNQLVDVDEKIYIIAHSVGILRSIIYCREYDLQPELIISMDGSYMNPSIIEMTIESKTEQLAQIYRDYVSIGCTDYNIMLFRQDKNYHADDERYYSSIFYYESNKGGHYPYDYPATRTKIIDSLDFKSGL